MSNASPKDSGVYACSITDVKSNESQTKQLSITVYGTVITIFNAYGKLTHDYILIVIQLQS